MSTDGPVEWLAIAFLVEASLNLSYDWKRLFQDYIVQLLQRCNITSGPNKLTRVAFVTYGTADTLPSPIVKKTYFTELRYIMQDIKDDSRRLGIGQTDSGRGKGMAALEGFATVLDMFDLLRNVGPKELDCRIVHIAASPPDSSDHPHWNQSPQLDSLTWELLPAELKKRNIQLSGINLSSGLPRFPELYTQAATGNYTSPWFNIKAHHHICINGFASIQPKAKRVADPTTAERTAEPKRPRTTQTSADGSHQSPVGQTPPSAQQTTSTPPAAPSSMGTNITQPLPPSTAQTAGSSSTPNAAPLTAAAVANPQFRQQIMQQVQLILAKRKQLEEESKMLAARKQAAMAQGNAEMSNFCDTEITKRREAFVKLGQALNGLHQQARRAQQGATPQGQEIPQSAPNPNIPQNTRSVTSPSGPTIKDPQTPFNQVVTPRQPQNTQSPVQNPQGTPARTVIPAGRATPTPNNTISSPPQRTPHAMTVPNTGALNAQMQKLLQLDRNRQLPPGTGIANASAQILPNEGGMNNGPGVANTIPQPILQPGQIPNSNQVQSILVWEGILIFNGTKSDGNKKEVRTAVSASSSNAANSHAETWPPSMTLVPATTPAVSIPEFQDWIRRTKPVLCTFKARTPDDETNYQMLVSVMSVKRMYATSAWGLPNGAHKEIVLIFPINNMGLCGAFFPLTGIPEMPKPSPTPAPQIPPAILSLISNLPPEQRAAAVQQIRQKVAAGPEVATNFFRALLQRQVLQQQNAQNRAAMANQFGLNPNMGQLGAMVGNLNNSNPMGAMGMNLMNAGTANPPVTMGNPSGMLQSMARAGTGAGQGAGMNLNYDVLQSFMQRNNPDSNNASGIGPS